MDQDSRIQRINEFRQAVSQLILANLVRLSNFLVAAEYDNEDQPESPTYSNSYLEKWLIARNYSQSRAHEMFSKSLELRRRYHIDSLLDWFEVPLVLQRYSTGGHMGVDCDGRIIWFESIKQFDPRGVLLHCTKEQLMLYRLFHIEKGIAKMRQSRSDALEQWPEVCDCVLPDDVTINSGPIRCDCPAGNFVPAFDQFLVVFDFDGFGLNHFYPPAVSALLSFISFFEANYPEFCYAILILNASWWFQRLYDLVCPLLDGRTKRKIVFVESGKEQETLLRYIPTDQLFESYGGTLTEYDRVGWGGKVPAELDA